MIPIAQSHPHREGYPEFYIESPVDKLGANDRTHAVTIAVRRGLLQIQSR